MLDELLIPSHEQVIAFGETAHGLRGFLAIHSTRLGPAFGGTRIRAYASEDEALADALRLSSAMTYNRITSYNVCYTKLLRRLRPCSTGR